MVGLLLSLFSMALAAIFYLLDLRTVQLIKIAERFLVKEEAHFSRALGDPDIALFRKSNLITRVSRICGARLSYGYLFYIFFA